MPRLYVCRVGADEGSSQSYGSGACIATTTGRSLVATANHVIKDAPQGCRVRLGSVWHAAKLVHADPLWDVAFLAIDTWWPSITVGDILPHTGRRMILAGFGSDNYLETTGFAAEFFSPGGLESKDWVTISTAGRPGDSGGPMLSPDGRLLGILWGSRDNLAYGTHCIRVRKILQKVVGYDDLIKRALAPANGVFFRK